MFLTDLEHTDVEVEMPRQRADGRLLRRHVDDARRDLLPRKTLDWAPFLWRRVLFPGMGATTSAISWKSLLALTALSSMLLLPWMSFHLFEPDEGRYAQIPAEMLARADWVTPTLQGMPYFDKPPLFYWAVMCSYALLGVHVWAARLVPALAVLGSVLITYVLGRRLVGERAAFWGALALLLAPGFIGTGRLLVLDGLLTLWVTLSLLAALLAIQRPTGNDRGPGPHLGWWLVASVACGLGVLTKGPVAVLLLVPPLLAHRWLAGAGVAIGFRAWAIFTGILLALTLPWYAAVTLQSPEFGGYFFWKHNVLRFVQPFDHERPVWFYLPLVLIGLFPATLLLPATLRWLFTSDESAARNRCTALGYLLLSGAWCVLFFSLAGSKLPTYILPALPPWCLAFGVFLTRTDWSQSRWVRGGAVATGTLIFVSHIWLTPAIAWQRSPLNCPDEVRAWCRDESTPVFCFPRNVDSMAFHAGRADFRTFRSKELSAMLAELDRCPRAVVLFAHRNSLGTLRHHLPPHLRITQDRPLGLCAMAIVERQ